MSAGPISLESAIRSCKVDTAWASKVESDRFFNPNNMVCPIWNGMDTSGRSVCPDSFYTKRAGCNSAEDRVVVENNVERPQYMEYITLSAGGISGNIYGNTMGHTKSEDRTKDLHNIHNVTGQFGQDFGATNISRCGYTPYKEAMAQKHAQMRDGHIMQVGREGSSRRQAAGF